MLTNDACKKVCNIYLWIVTAKKTNKFFAIVNFVLFKLVKKPLEAKEMYVESAGSLP